jgi:hypothetical protein
VASWHTIFFFAFAESTCCQGSSKPKPPKQKKPKKEKPKKEDKNAKGDAKDGKGGKDGKDAGKPAKPSPYQVNAPVLGGLCFYDNFF